MDVIYSNKIISQLKEFNWNQVKALIDIDNLTNRKKISLEYTIALLLGLKIKKLNYLIENDKREIKQAKSQLNFLAIKQTNVVESIPTF